MRVSTERRTYLKRISRLTRAQCGPFVSDVNWLDRMWRCGTDLFLFLYGLPLEIQLKLALRMLKRYIPNFEAQNPGDSRMRQLVEVASSWLRTPEAGKEAVMQVQLEQLNDDYSQLQFAVESLKNWLMHWTQDKALSAAAATDVLVFCITQRMYDVWRTDDPKGYAAEKRMTLLSETLMLMENELPAEVYQRLDKEYGKLLARFSNSWPGNIAAWAVGRREWAILERWLAQVERVYPCAESPSRRERRCLREMSFFWLV